MDTRTIDKRTTAVVLYDLHNLSLKNRDDPAQAKAIQESGLIPNLVRLVAGIRPHRIPIMWIHVKRRTEDLPDNIADVGGWQILSEWERALIDEMVVAPEDQAIHKLRRDAFIGTDLDLHLRARKVNTILLGGYATNWGVESTARTAYDLGYNVIVLSDCCYNVRADPAQILDREHHAAHLARDDRRHRVGLDQLASRSARPVQLSVPNSSHRRTSATDRGTPS